LLAKFKGIGGTAVNRIFRPTISIQAIDEELCGILNDKVIHGLDAARALAVTLVLVDHLRLLDHVLGIHLPLGSLGVMIFFVLSGFLITSLLLREYCRTGQISLSNFYRRRAYRIFPTFYCCWILTTGIEYFVHQLDWKAAFVSFFYFMDYWRAFGPPDTQSNMFISWSLAIEEKFYLLWPIFALLILRNRGSLIRIVTYVIFGQWVYRAILYLALHVRWNYVYYPFDMRVDALLAGCLLALILNDANGRQLCCRLIARQWFALVPSGALVFVVFAPSTNKLVFLPLWSLEPLIIAVMLLQAAYWGQKSWTICNSFVVITTARLSYALYLYHPLAGKVAYILHFPHVGYSTAVLALLMATASYYLIEKPFMRMRDHGRERAALPIGATRTTSVANAASE
jgi:peptidoglycan/LPS O-acetylase OafA/YrhL